MAEDQILLGLDIGTTKMCAVVGQTRSGELQILGYGQEESAGMKKGMVIDVEAAAAAIGKAVSQAEQKSGYKLSHVLISMAGEHLESHNSSGVVKLRNDENGIMLNDIRRVLDSSISSDLASDRDVLHVIPCKYQVDEQDGVINPIGMIGDRLGVDSHVITASASALRNLSRCVEMHDLQTERHILNIIASAESVLTPSEKEMGVIVADIGGGTTDIAILAGGAVWHTDVIAIGGKMFTSDIAHGLGVPFETAEQIKRQHGNCRPELFKDDSTFKVKPFNGQPFDAPMQELAFACEARALDLFELIYESLAKSSYQGLVPAGIVLTGGGSQLRNLTTVCEQVMHIPTRTAKPQKLSGLVDGLQKAEYATVLGLLQWVASPTHNALYVPEHHRKENEMTTDFRKNRVFNRTRSKKSRGSKTQAAKNGFTWFKDTFLVGENNNENES